MHNLNHINSMDSLPYDSRLKGAGQSTGRRPKLSALKQLELCQEYRDGVSIEALAYGYGISERTVKRTLESVGLIGGEDDD